MNAMAHAVESLYGIDTNPVVQTMAEEAVRLLGSSLPRDRPESARSRGTHGCALRAWLAANFRAEVGLEHAIAQRVRQWFNLDHAHTHAIATPYAIGFNASAAPDAMGRIKRALGVRDAARGLYDLNVRLGLPTGLKGLGLREERYRQSRRGGFGSQDRRIRGRCRRADLADVIRQAYFGEPPQF